MSTDAFALTVHNKVLWVHICIQTACSGCIQRLYSMEKLRTCTRRIHAVPWFSICVVTIAISKNHNNIIVVFTDPMQGQ